MSATVVKFRNGTIFPWVIREDNRTVAMFTEERIARQVCDYLNDPCEGAYEQGYDDGLDAVIENPSAYFGGRYE